MESAVRKSVEGEYVAGIFVQPAAEIPHRVAVAQFHRRPFAQAQADGERFLRADFFADSQRVILERLKCFQPRLATMDVRAIGELERMVQLHGRFTRCDEINCLQGANGR